MALEKLTSDEVDTYGSEYVSFLKSLRPGEGAEATTTDEGVTKVTLKRRLDRAAEAAGVEIEFLRSGPETVLLRRADKR